jgi:hypothetical protein
MSDPQPPVRRFDVLSRSESGLTFVRERRGGVTRVLTPSELADFDDPKPCPQCAEQFGCEHYNCAGEELLSDTDVDEVVPAEWRGLARDHGLSRIDLQRLATLEFRDSQYAVPRGAVADLRMLELVLILNDDR